MTDLDILRPEVRSALGAIVRADVCRDPVPTDAFDIIRADLLHLQGETDRLHKVACEQLRRAQKAEEELATLKAQSIYPRAQLLANFAAANERAEKAEAERDDLRTAYTSASQSRDYWRECAERIEAELAALKARIAEAPAVSLVYGQGDMLSVLSAENADDWAGKQVRLLVVEE